MEVKGQVGVKEHHNLWLYAPGIPGLVKLNGEWTFAGSVVKRQFGDYVSQLSLEEAKLCE